MRVDLHVLGVPFWNAGYEEFREWWDRVLSAETGRPTTLFIANAHTLNIACTNPSYAACFEKADAVVNDGFGYRIAARLRGCKTLYNFNGTDLFPRLFAEATSPLRVFLYGASDESNERTAQRIEQRYPMAKIVGRVNGYGPEDEAISMVNACAPDVLLCALGQPKQELFLMGARDRLSVKIVVGVGGLFDFLSGTKSRAPKFMRDSGFEWAYRLAQEPRRLFRRYVVGNPLFLVRCFLYLRRDKRLTAKGVRELDAASHAGSEAEPAQKT
jgi:exopolysaccharide biosynthesis WecB/TagA/CpsF family protein